MAWTPVITQMKRQKDFRVARIGLLIAQCGLAGLVLWALATLALHHKIAAENQWALLFFLGFAIATIVAVVGIAKSKPYGYYLESWLLWAVFLFVITNQVWEWSLNCIGNVCAGFGVLSLSLHFATLGKRRKLELRNGYPSQ